ncbi:hypothetical protein KP509_16G049800 [Ceratopteris richardii]|uniref:Phospholipase A1 n=1 Tax=Ceratopteris richardii TaxID=49495 RepID=A0A8T2T060_CERRI|nr:hypothetical protein KP509_16G049800 [Ceratopteris richardii]
MGSHHSRPARRKIAQAPSMEEARYHSDHAADDELLPPLSERWREIQGLHHWKGLLEPLDMDLRRSVIRYGEFNQAIYDAFDSEPHSKYIGSSKYRKEELFQRVGLQAEDGEDSWGYEVSRYLYATATSHILGRFFLSSRSKEAWSKESNWIGYVAVATDKGKEWLGRRDIVVVWRGTLRLFEWIDDFHLQKSEAADYLVPEVDADDIGEPSWFDRLRDKANENWRFLFDFEKKDVTDLHPQQSREAEHKWYDFFHRTGHEKPRVEKGWLLIYTSSDERSPYTQTSARDQVLDELKYLLEKYKDEDVSITVVGHSLGASLAVLNAYDIAESGLNVRGDGREPVLVTAVVFGCPLVGDAAFKKRCEELEGLRILRVKNKRDLIALYPPTFMGYREVGKELLVDHQLSPFLNQASRTIGDWHNLEMHLHMVAGSQGGGDEPSFRLAVDRDPAIVNKSCNFLSEEMHIPGSWWQERFKGLRRNAASGKWYLPDRPAVHEPQPECMRQQLS